MKKDVKYALFTALLAVSMAFAGNGDKEGKSKAVKFSAAQLHGFEKITVKDAYGQVLYTQSLNDTQAKVYDFSKLDAGFYTVELDSEVKTVRYPLWLNEEDAALKLNEKTEVFKPFAQFENARLNLMAFNPEMQPIKVTIYNDAEQIIYTESLAAGSLEMKRAYKIKDYKGGFLRVAIEKDNQIFSFGFNSY